MAAATVASSSAAQDSAVLCPSALVLGENVACIYCGTTNQLVNLSTPNALCVYTSASSAGQLQLRVENATLPSEPEHAAQPFSLQNCTRITLNRRASLRFEWTNETNERYSAAMNRERILEITLYSAQLHGLPTLCSKLYINFGGACVLSGRLAFAQRENVARFATISISETPLIDTRSALEVHSLQVNCQIHHNPAETSRRRIVLRESDYPQPARRVRRRVFTAGADGSVVLDSDIQGTAELSGFRPDAMSAIYDSMMPLFAESIASLAYARSHATQDEEEERRVSVDPLGVWRARLVRKRDSILALNELKGFLRCGQGAAALQRYAQEDPLCKRAKNMSLYSTEFSAALDEIALPLSTLAERAEDAPPLAPTDSSDTAPECIVCKDAYGMFSVCEQCSADKSLCEQCLDNCVLHNCIKTCITCRGVLRKTAKLV